MLSELALENKSVCRVDFLPDTRKAVLNELALRCFQRARMYHACKP